MAPTSGGQGFKAQARQGADSRAARQNLFGDYARTTFRWEGVNAGLVLDGIISALNRGDAVTLSLTPDGGAVKLTWWKGGEKHVGYAADDDALHALAGVLQGEEPQDEVPRDFKGTEGRRK